MIERYSHPAPLEITATIFDDLECSHKDFAGHVRKYYNYVCLKHNYEPILNDSRLMDSWVSFCRDKKHMANSLPDSKDTPDHFKIAGILVYWLRRFAPVYDLRDLSTFRNASPVLMKLIKEYPSELLAFDFGLSICNFFESNKGNPASKPAIADNDFEYYKLICYMMKFKNLSPHSLGVIYRSLYVPIIFNKKSLEITGG